MLLRVGLLSFLFWCYFFSFFLHWSYDLLYCHFSSINGFCFSATFQSLEILSFGQLSLRIFSTAFSSSILSSYFIFILLQETTSTFLAFYLHAEIWFLVNFWTLKKREYSCCTLSHICLNLFEFKLTCSVLSCLKLHGYLQSLNCSHLNSTVFFRFSHRWSLYHSLPKIDCATYFSELVCAARFFKMKI